MFLCEEQEEERWKKAYMYTEFPHYWVRDLTLYSLDTNKNWRCSIENRI